MPTQSKPTAPPPVPTATDVLDRMLGTEEQPSTDQPSRAGTAAGFGTAEVLAWSDVSGTLTDGRGARLAVSCLLRPVAGDRVVVWSESDGERWVLNVLERSADGPARVGTSGPLTIEAPRVLLTGEAVHVQAVDFLTSTRNRHAVEDVRTETVRTRVADIGTDIRRASHASDEVRGTVLQRAGSWISTTLREARLTAKAFLFD